MERIEVELHSTEPTAVEATRLVFRMLNAELEEKDGKFYVLTDHPEFIRFAAVQQGYVKAVVDSSAAPPTNSSGSSPTAALMRWKTSSPSAST